MRNGLAVEHSYYCSETNYFANREEGGPFRYDSWEAFESDYGDADYDYNLIFRWDWKRFEDDEDDDEEKDDRDTLQLCVLQQRKGKYCSLLVRVTDEDAPKVREFLEQRWKHLQDLWAPISKRK